MPAEIRIYFEGHPLLKSGFNAFFSELRERARRKRCRFYLVPSKSGTEARRDFGVALKVNRTAWNILLTDSEGPCHSNLSLDLCVKEKWSKSHKESIFWMVEMMESWFHADKDRLAAYYGDGFKRNVLKANPKAEEIPKKDLISGLRAATRNTLKGDYFEHKAEHAADLLERIRPELVRQAAPNCDRLFTAVLKRLR
jgi:hypothetical protein